MESDSEGEENTRDGERDLPADEEDETCEDVEVNLHLFHAAESPLNVFIFD